MDVHRVTYLFYRHIDGTASPEERLELADVLQKAEQEGDVKKLMKEAWETFNVSYAPFSREMSDRMMERILEADGKTLREAVAKEPRRGFLWQRIAAAVGMLLLAGAGFIYYKNVSGTSGQIPDESSLTVSEDILPGGNKAILTLIDGSSIVLDSASAGQLARQGDMLVWKTGEGQLAYEMEGDRQSLQHIRAGHNTLRTPRGGQYSLVLPDGSKVWLNAASSIRYPVRFDEGIREVEISGEVYFEIAKRENPERPGKNIPFRVYINKMEIEVLGTHFNVKAYQEERRILTTLLEGAVRVRNGSAKSLLKPGQQASVSPEAPGIEVADVNTGQAIAWKNGYFKFYKADLGEIMRQLSKWYDVDVRYEDTLADREFSGEIPRSATLLEVLGILELSNVRLDMEGREIVIRP